MDLAISSAALPGASLDELSAAAARRGFAGLELVAGHGHGVTPGRPAPAALQIAPRQEVRIIGYRVAAVEDVLAPGVVRLAAAMSAPVIVPTPVDDSELVSAAAAIYEQNAANLLLTISPSREEALRVEELLHGVPCPAFGVSLEIDPAHDDLGGISELIRLVRPRLRMVRLRGGGPEGVTQLGRGVGGLMAALALSRFAHPLVLTPGRAEARRVWEMWLGREKGAWGCGGAAAPVALPGASAA